VEETPAYINILNYLFVGVYMLSVPLETTRGEIRGTLGDWNLMGRAFLANFVIIPLLGIIITQFLVLPPDVGIGFLLLGFAPGGLLALQFARVSKGNRVFAVALLLVFCGLAILVTPLLVYLFFPREGAGRLPLGWLTMMLLLLTVIPLIVGRALQRLIPQRAPKLGLWLGRLSIVIFIIAKNVGRGRRHRVVPRSNRGLREVVFSVR
jgi:bile acid:Na+ symporter, BASS family